MFRVGGGEGRTKRGEKRRGEETKPLSEDGVVLADKWESRLTSELRGFCLSRKQNGFHVGKFKANNTKLAQQLIASERFFRLTSPLVALSFRLMQRVWSRMWGTGRCWTLDTPEFGLSVRLGADFNLLIFSFLIRKIG